MKNKKVTTIIILGIFTLGLIGCSNSNAETDTKNETVTEEVVEVVETDPIKKITKEEYETFQKAYYDYFKEWFKTTQLDYHAKLTPDELKTMGENIKETSEILKNTEIPDVLKQDVLDFVKCSYDSGISDLGIQKLENSQRIEQGNKTSQLMLKIEETIKKIKQNLGINNTNK